MKKTAIKENIAEIEKDEIQLRKSGIPADEIARQIALITDGIPPADLVKPCTVGDGIKVITGQETKSLNMLFEDAVNKGRFMKFVPASGAASRMFKDLEFLNTEYDDLPIETLRKKALANNKPYGTGLTFIKGIHKFAFFDELKQVLEKEGFDIENLLRRGKCLPLIDYTISPKGLNYSALPKALILFHRYDDRAVTAMEEHLIDGRQTIASAEGKVSIHFTLSESHIDLFHELLESVREGIEEQQYSLDISWSTQSPQTNTIALASDNSIFRDEEGDWLFRPGGHGALLGNLNDLNADLVFISNIDNIVPAKLKSVIYETLRNIGGLLVAVQDDIFSYIRLIENGDITGDKEEELQKFLTGTLSVLLPKKFSSLPKQDRYSYYTKKLNRPLRVASMVKNEGHPGGGPFWVRNNSGEISLQIVEAAQIERKKPDQLSALNASTHFNPVYLACGLKDYKGNNFNLFDFRDNNTGFVTEKSYNGRELKALELPGLWNGAMADWNTVFVEIPKSSFNPVKQVTDLLKQEHQP